MSKFDLVVRGGQVVTASSKAIQDIGIKNGRIVALGHDLASAAKEINASGKLVLPGGIDSHCHIEQRSSSGLMTADDFYSATVSAAFGGTTTIIPFAAQHQGQRLRSVVADYHACSRPKAVIDYAYHLIVADPTPENMQEDLPQLIQDGITSFKIYMTYAALKLDDYQILDVLTAARKLQALTMIHAENHDVIRWLTDRLLAKNCHAPRYHAVAHARISESEATHRAIALAELVDTPLLVVHVSSKEATAEIRRAQENGLKIFAETCPQYLFLTAQDLDLPGMDGAMNCCSPPPRDKASQEAVWQGLNNNTFQVFSSDHAPYRYDDSGKLNAGNKPPFNKIANGVPGLEIRLPMLFSEGVGKGRMDIHTFVQVTATNAAKLYGLYPRKGDIQVGADADIAIWDPDKEVIISTDMLHDNAGYTPYEGRQVKGWPTTILSRGRIVVDENELKVEAGSGEFLPCEKPNSALPLKRFVTEANPKTNFGADILD